MDITSSLEFSMILQPTDIIAMSSDRAIVLQFSYFLKVYSRNSF